MLDEECPYCTDPMLQNHFQSCQSFYQNSTIYLAVLETIEKGYSWESVKIELKGISELNLNEVSQSIPKELEDKTIQLPSYPPQIEEEKIPPPKKYKSPIIEKPQNKNILREACIVCKEKKENIHYPNCLHPICLDDLQNLVVNKYPEIRCPQQDCDLVYNIEHLEGLLGPQLLTELESHYFEKLGKEENLVACLCGQLLDLEPGNIDAPVVDSKGETLSEQATLHYSKYRFRCNSCQQVVCSQCKESPYHLGFTCEEWQIEKLLETCLYCEKKTKEGNEICENEACEKKLRKRCEKYEKCGHRCLGIKKEQKECLGCLKPGCSKYKETEEDLCQICKEELRTNNCVKLICGHIFHEACILYRLENRWPGPRITFLFATCPLCSK